MILSTIYIFNVAQNKYLYIGENGKASLSDSPQSINLTPMSDGTGRYQDDYASFDDNSKTAQWYIKTIDSANGTYAIGYNSPDAYTTNFVYATHNNMDNQVATSYTEPNKDFAPGIWRISTQDFEEQDIKLDENCTTYVAPSITKDKTRATLIRKFAPGKWNSLCLPFSLTSEQIEATWGTGTQVATYKAFNNEKTKLVFEACDIIEAGKPCLLRPASTSSDNTYTIPGINANDWDTSSAPAPLVSEGQSMQYVGTYRNIGNAPYNTYIFGGDDKMYYVNSNVGMKGFRAYFKDSDNTSPAKLLTWGLNDTPTSIDIIPSVNASAPKDIYRTDGTLARKHATSTQGLKPGVYIMSGMKVVVK